MGVEGSKNEGERRRDAFSSYSFLLDMDVVEVEGGEERLEERWRENRKLSVFPSFSKCVFVQLMKRALTLTTWCTQNVLDQEKEGTAW